MRWVGHIWATRQFNIGFWWGNLGGERPLGRQRHRQKNSIKMVLQETGWRCRLQFSDHDRNK